MAEPIPTQAAVYCRWTPTSGMVEATSAKGFDVPGFQDCRLFTAAEVDHEEGVWVFRAYEGRAGMALGEPKRFRDLAEISAKQELRRVGFEAFEARVVEVLAKREAERG